MTGIRQQRTQISIARKRTTQHFKNVLLPIPIEIRKADRMALL